MKKIVSMMLVGMLIFALTIGVNAALPYLLGYNSDALVLMYHKLSENPEEWQAFCTSPEIFESDIKYLKDNGYVFKTASELAIEDTEKTDKVVVITFDDGYQSDYDYVLPILEKYSAKATFFVIGSLVDTPGYLNTESLKKLSESPLAEIGNHSYELHKNTHIEIRRLMNENTYESVIADFEKNNSYLEGVIGKNVTALSYPNGVYTPMVNSKIMEKDILITFSTDNNRLRYPLVDPVGRKNRDHDGDFLQIVGAGNGGLMGMNFDTYKGEVNVTPSTDKPALVKPEVEVPNTDKPALVKPEVEVPGANKPALVKPEVEVPNTNKPVLVRPEVNTESNSSKPNNVNGGIMQWIKVSEVLKGGNIASGR